MQIYTHYKESGIDWIGQIPEHWEISKLGNILKPYSVKNKAHLPLLSITREKGVILRGDDPEESNHNFIPDDLSGYKHIKKGQFGMNKMKAWQGSYGYSNFEGIVSPAYYIFDISDKLYGDYFSKTIRSNAFIPFFIKASDGVRIGQWDLSKPRMKEIPFYIPPIHEQEAIANFLDKKTAKIDALVQTKEQQIEKLKELRQAKIHQAVTKGIPCHAELVEASSKTHALSKVEIKDSGIEWIGEIPAHWEVKKMKSISSKIGDGLHGTPEYDDSGEYYFINGNNLGDNKITIYDSTKLVNKKQFLLNKKPLNRQTILLSINGTIGNVSFYNDENVMLGKSACYINLNKDINKEFISYFLNSKSFKDYYSIVLSGSTIYNLSLHSVANVSFAYPPIQEQEQIVAYLDEVTGKIDQAVTQKQEQITKLKEYKQSLINNVVTGKVKVC